MTDDCSPRTKRQKKNGEKQSCDNEDKTSTDSSKPQQNFNEMDSEYFSSYTNMGVHEAMLADTVRTNAYRAAILKNYPLFYGKVVMDVGSGTGILSVFSCQAGAKKVYAVEASGMASEINKVAAENGYADRITVINSKLEDIKDLPEEVDVIVSEWMGHSLLHEAMLPSVLWARDKFLKKSGSLFPDKATLFMAPFTDEEYDKRIDEWKLLSSRYKVSMECLLPRLKKTIAGEVITKPLLPENVIARSQELTTLELNTMAVEDTQKVKSSFDFSCFGHARIHGFVTWFMVEFPGGTILNTSPYHDETHWCQTEFYLGEPFDVKQDTRIHGHMSMFPNKKKSRYMDVEVSYAVDDGPVLEQTFVLS